MGVDHFTLDWIVNGHFATQRQSNDPERISDHVKAEIIGKSSLV
jgi:hypothetical protein